jgi:hypothetical protein
VRWTLAFGAALALLCAATAHAAGPPVEKRGDGSGSTALPPPALTRLDVLSVDVVRWSSEGRYRRLWAMLHPLDRRATTWTFWRRCQQGRRRRAGAVEVQARFPAHRLTAVSVAYTTNGRRAQTVLYWARYRGRWKRVWAAREYRAYRHARCPADILG